jgi:hypothetical protein
MQETRKRKAAVIAGKLRKSVDVVVEAMVEEFSGYVPPWKKRLYTYLLAIVKGENPQRPKDLKSKGSIESFDYCIEKYNELFGDIPGPVQQIILERQLKATEVEQIEYEKENARQEAFDKVLDALSDWTTGELLYLAERIKNGALGLAVK